MNIDADEGTAHLRWGEGVHWFFLLSFRSWTCIPWTFLQSHTCKRQKRLSKAFSRTATQKWSSGSNVGSPQTQSMRLYYWNTLENNTCSHEGMTDWTATSSLKIRTMQSPCSPKITDARHVKTKIMGRKTRGTSTKMAKWEGTWNAETKENIFAETNSIQRELVLYKDRVTQSFYSCKQRYTSLPQSAKKGDLLIQGNAQLHNATVRWITHTDPAAEL